MGQAEGEAAGEAATPSERARVRAFAYMHTCVRATAQAGNA